MKPAMPIWESGTRRAVPWWLIIILMVLIPPTGLLLSDLLLETEFWGEKSITSNVFAILANATGFQLYAGLRWIVVWQRKREQGTESFARNLRRYLTIIVVSGLAIFAALLVLVAALVMALLLGHR